MNRKSSMWQLFSTFFRIGLFTFGGGFAMLPLIEKEIVDKQRWAERDEIMDIVALAQSVPGAIGVNIAVFIGQRLFGLLGALVALLGVVTPSVIIILTIAQFFTQFQTNPYVASAFAGVRAAVIGLLAGAAVRVGKGVVIDRVGLVIALAALLVSVFDIIPVIWVIILGGFAGYFYYVVFKGSFGRK